MTNLDFKDSLEENPFVRDNNFVYHPLNVLDIHITDDHKEEPYIKHGATKGIRTERYWSMGGGGPITIPHTEGTISFSTFNNQFNNKVLTTARVKEVIDGARVPLMIRLDGIWYLMGKGFLASMDERARVKLLFVATVKKGEKIGNISQVKFYVSRQIYTDMHKRLSPSIRDIIMAHTGDVVITNDIENHIGYTFSFPEFKTLKERKEYMDNLVNQSFTNARQDQLAKSTAHVSSDALSSTTTAESTTAALR